METQSQEEDYDIPEEVENVIGQSALPPELRNTHTLSLLLSIYLSLSALSLVLSIM